MKRTISIGTAAVFGVGSALLALSPAAQAAPITYDCDIPTVGTTEVHVDIETTLPDTAEPKDSLPFDVDLTVTLPAEATTALHEAGARTADGSASEELEISTPTNAPYTRVVDVTFDESAVTVDEALELSGTSTTDPIRALGEGDLIVYAGPLDIDLALYDDDDGTQLPFDSFSCTGPSGNSASHVHTVIIEEDDSDAEPLPTTTTLEVSEPVIDWGTGPIEFTATVEAEDGDGTPTGDVEFFLNGGSLGDAMPVVNGTATYELTDNLSAGFYEVRADFIPAGQDYAGSTDDAEFVVYADTETALGLTETEFEQGADVYAVAMVSTVPDEAGDPAGDVEFTIEGLTDDDVQTTNPAVWALPTDEIPPGEYTIVATFRGNAAFGESVSKEVDFTVLPAG